MKEETLLEQMTRVRPEMLNEETLKLFNKIIEVIDERDKLFRENSILKGTLINIKTLIYEDCVYPCIDSCADGEIVSNLTDTEVKNLLKIIEKCEGELK